MCTVFLNLNLDRTMHNDLVPYGYSRQFIISNIKLRWTLHQTMDSHLRACQTMVLP